MMTVFERIGGIVPRTGLRFRSIRVPMAPISVARLPKMISGTAAPPMKLASRQPIYRPGTAAPEKSGRIVRASAMRTWTSRKEIGAKTMVSAT